MPPGHYPPRLTTAQPLCMLSHSHRATSPCCTACRPTRGAPFDAAIIAFSHHVVSDARFPNPSPKRQQSRPALSLRQHHHPCRPPQSTCSVLQPDSKFQLRRCLQHASLSLVFRSDPLISSIYSHYTAMTRSSPMLSLPSICLHHLFVRARPTISHFLFLQLSQHLFPSFPQRHHTDMYARALPLRVLRSAPAFQL